MTAKIGSKKNVTLAFINGCVVMSRKLRLGKNALENQTSPARVV